MIQEEYQQLINFNDNMHNFNADDIIIEKIKYYMSKYGYYQCYGDHFINSEDIDFSYENHNANCGVFVCEILPMGEIQLKPIQLDNESSMFYLYLESSDNITSEASNDGGINFIEFVDNIVKFEIPTNNIILMFKNNNTKKVMIDFYSLMY